MMTSPSLSDDVEAGLRGLVAVGVEVLGDNLVGVFLEGSFAWGNPVATSDIDVRIVVNSQPTDAERARLLTARERTQQALGREIGVGIERLDDLMRVGALRLQRSRWLAGEDIRDRVPAKSIEAFVRDAMLTAHDLVVSARTRHGRRACHPLQAPSPGAEFRGYDFREVLDRGRWVPSSKRLVTNVTAVATARIAARARIFVLTKGEVAALYAAHVADEWTAFVDEVYRRCRIEAAYLIPEEPSERSKLTALCERAVAFETLFLGESLAYLRTLVASGNEMDRAAGERRLAAIDQAPET